MSNEVTKDLILGMLYALCHAFKDEFNQSQRENFKKIEDTINNIYYPKKDLTQPTIRDFVCKNSDMGL